MKATKNKTNRGAATPARKPTTGAKARKEEIIDLVPALISIGSILVPIDFSDTSKKALQYAVRFAEQFGGKITVLHVVEPVATPDFAYYPLVMESDKAKAAAKSKLDTLCSQMQVPRQLLERTIVRYGSPFAEITDAARTLKVDLIIITTHGYTGLKHVFLGSTAERVVRHAPCPVLTVREKEHEIV